MTADLFYLPPRIAGGFRRYRSPPCRGLRAGSLCPRRLPAARGRAARSRALLRRPGRRGDGRVGPADADRDRRAAGDAARSVGGEARLQGARRGQATRADGLPTQRATTATPSCCWSATCLTTARSGSSSLPLYAITLPAAVDPERVLVAGTGARRPGGTGGGGASHPADPGGRARPSDLRGTR